MTIEEIKTLIHEYFEKSTHDKSPRVATVLRLVVLIGKKKCNSGIYLHIEENQLDYNVYLGIRDIGLKKLYIKYAQNFPKYLHTVPTIKQELISLKESYQLISGYLEDFKNELDEKYNSMGYMRYTKLFICSEAGLIEIKED